MVDNSGLIGGGGLKAGDNRRDVEFAITYPDQGSLSITNTNTYSPIVVKSDGGKIYTLREASNQVVEYSLSTANDITTAGAATTKSVNSEPRGLWFKPDGTSFYITVDNGATHTVVRYDMSTAWDISSAGSSVAIFSVASQVTTPKGLSFSNDGTRMFVHSDGTVYSYTLSTAWDITSASYDSKNIVLSTLTPGANFFSFFNSDGSIFYSTSGSSIVEFSVGTNYDIETLTVSKKLDTDTDNFANGVANNGFNFSSDGNRLFICHNGTSIVQLDLDNAFDLSISQEILNLSGVKGNLKYVGLNRFEDVISAIGLYNCRVTTNIDGAGDRTGHDNKIFDQSSSNLYPSQQPIYIPIEEEFRNSLVVKIPRIAANNYKGFLRYYLK